MKKLNIYSSLAKLGLVSTVLLTGCSQTTELKPTPPTTGNEVPPTTEVVPTPESNVHIDKDNGIEIFEKNGDEYKMLVNWEEYGIEDKFQQFLIDYMYLCTNASPGELSRILEENPEIYENYLTDNILIIMGKLKKFENAENNFETSVSRSQNHMEIYKEKNPQTLELAREIENGVKSK